ncbi:hypothetical protein DPEC_G00061130 [Dallia pectoralis]|uniref:Uncharacterized protein n=1 Tax=Dallia pectoralis TaxID=75939 RepID=A0ACC2H743_DALPE|nr:hypothetical protein DPEC_G00061130 [Dallia pectoralis]
MQLCYGPMGCFTLVIIINSLIASSSGSIKEFKCCTEVSADKINATIIGFRFQKRNPPCVKAVVFETEDGEICSYWKADWVRRTLVQLEQARKSMNQNPTVSTDNNRISTKST